MARLIDTSVLVTLDRRKGDFQDLKRIVAGDEFAIASITAAELLAGVLRTRPSRRRAQREQLVEAFLSETLVVPFDLAAAHACPPLG